MTWNDSQPYEQDERERSDLPYQHDRSSGGSRQSRQERHNDSGRNRPNTLSSQNNSSRDRAPYQDAQGRSERTHSSSRSSRNTRHEDQGPYEPEYDRPPSSSRAYRENYDRSAYDQDRAYEYERSSRFGRASRQNWQDDPYTQTEDEESLQPLWQGENYPQYRGFHPQQRSTRVKAPLTRRQRLARWVKAHRALSIVLLVSILVVSLSGIVTAAQMYSQYSTVHAEAVGGMKHLKRVQALLKPLSKQLTIPDPTLVKAVEGELTLAENDFAAARRDSGAWGISLAGHTPIFGNTASSAVALVTAADEATLGGLALLHAVELAQPLLHAGFLAPEAGTKTPYLTSAIMSQIIQDFETGTSKIESAVALAQNADLSTIPENFVSASQRTQLAQFLEHWPSFRGQLQSVDSWLHLAPTLLGVNGPQKLLVELMDRGEVRSTGGFLGSYGVLTVQSGQIQPFTLSDVFGLDIPYINRVGYQPPPAKYFWWPFAGYALRDSNLSYDFPTSAKAAIGLLKTEGGPDVQGVVAITLPVIQRAMKIIGSVPLPQYGVTVTPDTLEPLIRYYTETKAANAGTDLPPNDQLTTIHERFTALLGRAFMAKLHKANTKQLVAIAQMLVASMPTKDMQLYLSNSEAENLIKARGLDSSMTRGPQDGITIVDSNTTGNKANLFTDVNYTDVVSVDSHGTATHRLTINYDFSSAKDPSMVHYLYHISYYKTYLRVYTPANAKLVSYDGFNGGQEQINASDEPDRQMWGGFVYVQDGVPYSLHFTWTVAHAATQDSTGKWHYPLIFQHQAASRQHLMLTIIMPGSSKPTFTYNGVIDRDKLFTTP